MKRKNKIISMLCTIFLLVVIFSSNTFATEIKTRRIQ